jgi:very-short-patch-repair endonuclease
MTRIFNRKTEKEKRRNLRNNPTYTEKILWLSLRKKQIHNVRFLRQYSVNHFIIDFYSPKIKLAIEVDGSSHIGREEYDLVRQNYIKTFGIEFIRFTDEQVMGNTVKVVKEIEDVVKYKLGKLNPNLPIKKRGGKI